MSLRAEVLLPVWTEAWPKALDAWSRYTRLRPPLLCTDPGQAKREGLEGSFAMIRLEDQAIIIDLRQIAALGLDDYGVEILAHEIGHHVLAPASLSEHARLIARMRAALPTVEAKAPMVANLYTDLLINDRLQRIEDLRLADIFRILRRDRDGGKLWTLYMRIYERLWSLRRGSLDPGTVDAAMEGDALLGARLIRSFARDWLDGAGRFAALILPYLLEDQTSQEIIGKLADTRNAGRGGDPAGLTEVDSEEAAGAIHPAHDPGLMGDEPSEDGEEPGKEGRKRDTVGRGTASTQLGSPGGQRREPFQYGEILRAAGIDISDHDAAIRYYREQALPHLVPFPRLRQPQGADPLPEGLEPWDIGQPLDDVDWLQTVLTSPRIIPGLTTVQRVHGLTEGAQPRYSPVDLDIYVDSSGSMPNPQRQVSYPSLAGAILALSALRVGARVQATLWSGARQFLVTDGFRRDETEILRVLTGYFGGGTAFPIHILRDTYLARRPTDRAVHIVVVSDDGVTTMFDKDEENNSGWDVAALALTTARAGGTLVLNIPSDWESHQTRGYVQELQRSRKQGWDIHAVPTLEGLVAFARAFARKHYDVSARLEGAA